MPRTSRLTKYDTLVDEARRHILRMAIDRCGGNVALLAKWLEVDALWMRRHLKSLGLQEYAQEARLDRREAAGNSGGGNGQASEET